MSTATDVDIATLVGPLETIPCEHSQHGADGAAHDTGPATHYLRYACPKCEVVQGLYATCERFTNLVRNNSAIHCKCGYTGLAQEFITILGPVPTGL